MAIPRVTKRAYETRILEVNLGPRMRDSDSIGAITTITSSDAAITIDEISHNAAVVFFRAAGGTAGTKYKVVIRFITAGSPVQNLEAVIDLVIVAN